MAELKIRLARGDDGRVTLSIIRPDGSSTWHRLHPGLTAHDLYHFAVERVLGARNGFFGLVAQGWDISAFAEPGASRELPYEGIWIEHVVGLLQQESISGAKLNEAEMEIVLAEMAREDGKEPPRRITDGELRLIREELRDLLDRWSRCPPGATLELAFPLPEGLARRR